ncbi:MAG: dienelactone hydrolase family protein [Chloroflexi bacterium]|nr:dienelactone hydrolase family protein [Chloroflexota bacterium]
MNVRDMANAGKNGAGQDTSLRDYILEEFIEDYQEGEINRREALQRIAGITGSVALASSILAACGAPEEQEAAPDSATESAAEQPSPTTEMAASEDLPPGVTVSPDDPSIDARAVEIAVGDVTLLGYLAGPAGDGPFPGVLVCHENRGLNEHIRDVARRFGRDGYVALALDMLSRQGGTEAAGGASSAPGLLSNIPPQQFVDDFMAGLQFLQSQAFVAPNRLGMTGFCFGGGVTWRCATQISELKAAVPFYGPNPPLADVPNIQAAVLAIYAEQDRRINAGIEAIEAAMQEHDKTFQKIIYPNANHAFHNDTSSRYHAESANDAWKQMLSWFAEHV